MARAIFERAKTENFSKLVREASEDSATRATDGFLPAVSREEVPPQIRAVAWGLAEGAVSRIIPSQIGLHIVRRATLSESRLGLKRWLAPRYSRRADSTFVDSLARAAQMVIAEDARNRVRGMLHEPLRVGGGGPLVTWKDGALTPEAAHDWIVMIPAPERATLAVASDSALTSFLREMTQRELILARAGASHRVAAKARGLLAPQYHSAVAELLNEVGSMTAGGAGGTGALGVRRFAGAGPLALSAAAWRAFRRAAQQVRGEHRYRLDQQGGEVHPDALGRVARQ
ncbi:MAG: peptidylprolyl isomerase [Gemmatimonadetes bacterium]|nr:peptidylprolyl isomerase [Gemmatimonadota bacterium]